MKKYIFILLLIFLVFGCKDKLPEMDINIGFYKILDSNSNKKELNLVLGTSIVSNINKKGDFKYYLIKEHPDISEQAFLSGRLEYEDLEKPRIHVQFKDEAHEKFRIFTSENLNKPIAIIKNGKLVSIPYIREEINDGKCIITGKLNLDEAMKITSIFQ